MEEWKGGSVGNAGKCDVGMLMTSECWQCVVEMVEVEDKKHEQYNLFNINLPGVEMANLWWQSESFGTQAISSWFRLILSLPWLEKAFLA